MLASKVPADMKPRTADGGGVDEPSSAGGCVSSRGGARRDDSDDDEFVGAVAFGPRSKDSVVVALAVCVAFALSGGPRDVLLLDGDDVERPSVTAVLAHAPQVFTAH